MSILLTVIIPAHDPRGDFIALALDALKAQTLPPSQWELVVVDNASTPPLASRLELAWHPHARIVREDRLGLTRARLAGFAHTSGDVAVLVDDDNVLAPDFLEQVLRVAASQPFLGAWGGVISPRFEDPTLAPPASMYPLLTLRSASHDLWSNDPDHHASTPWGAGLCVRRDVAVEYARQLEDNPRRLSLDLNGKRLLYGGDTDIAYTACSMGLGKGVLTALRLEHLIPASRCRADYLCKVAEGRGFSEVLHACALGRRVEEPTLLERVRFRAKLARMGALEAAAARAHELGRRRAMAEMRVTEGHAA